MISGKLPFAQVLVPFGNNFHAIFSSFLFQQETLLKLGTAGAGYKLEALLTIVPYRGPLSKKNREISGNCTGDVPYRGSVAIPYNRHPL